MVNITYVTDVNKICVFLRDVFRFLSLEGPIIHKGDLVFVCDVSSVAIYNVFPVIVWLR